MTVRRQIVALGGGGFSQEPDNLALDRYVLAAYWVERHGDVAHETRLPVSYQGA